MYTPTPYDRSQYRRLVEVVASNYSRIAAQLIISSAKVINVVLPRPSNTSNSILNCCRRLPYEVFFSFPSDRYNYRVNRIPVPRRSQEQSSRSHSDIFRKSKKRPFPNDTDIAIASRSFGVRASVFFFFFFSLNKKYNFRSYRTRFSLVSRFS